MMAAGQGQLQRCGPDSSPLFGFALGTADGDHPSATALPKCDRDVQHDAPSLAITSLACPATAGSGGSCDRLGGLPGIGGEAADATGPQPEFQIRRDHDDPLHQQPDQPLLFGREQLVPHPVDHASWRP